MKKMMNRGIYTYAILERGASLNGFIRKYPELKFLNHGNLSMVYKIVDVSQFENEIKKNSKNLESISKFLKKHEEVIDELNKLTVSVPFKFGTILRSLESAKTLLKEKELFFDKLLKRFKNKEEWGIKLYKEDQNLQKFLFGDFQKFSINSGSDYLQAKREEKTQLKKVDDFLADLSNEFLNTMGNLSKEFSISDRLKVFKEEKEDYFLNSSFLISTKKRQEFRILTNELADKYKKMGIGLSISGPWPPYSFLHENK